MRTSVVICFLAEMVQNCTTKCTCTPKIHSTKCTKRNSTICTQYKKVQLVLLIDACQHLLHAEIVQIVLHKKIRSTKRTIKKSTICT